ncbi:MAG: antibiotic biosynthesis monooxygenase [Magnetococcales bacterium]|nr:antibiotic biosynthesis monooxygenase [Magnetococcales bacterium]
MFIDTPEPPYYAIIFSSLRTPGDHGYQAMAERMMQLVQQQSGFLGVESVRKRDGFGITVSYWQQETDALAWKQQSEHLLAQELGRNQWYTRYSVRVARVEREYAFCPNATFPDVS